jgi:DNA-binding NtrC family response regulator
MNLGNTFTAVSVSASRRVSAAPDWPLADGESGAMEQTMDDETTDEMTASPDLPSDAIEAAGEAAAEADAAAEAAMDAGRGQAVVIDEFDPRLSFRDAKERAIALWERWYVAELLRHTRGNLSEAARVAHSDRSHLRKLVRKHLRRDVEPVADAAVAEAGDTAPGGVD